MITISLCMIVKNEQSVLARCLDSIKEAVNEIIIVDTGSADNTKKIVGKYTDKIYDFEWIDDFSAARNFAFSKAEMDYQMWLDADDVVPAEELKKILQLKHSLDPNVDIVTMQYLTHFDADGNPIFTSTRERLLKREKGYLWQDPVHECIPLTGNIYYSDIQIHHRNNKAGTSTRNLNIYKKLADTGKALTPRQLYYYARELKDHGLWEESAQQFEKFLDTGQGWFEDNIACCYNLSVCYRQLNRREKILPVLLKSFTFDAPRAEICTQIGYYYKEQRNFATALKWFRVALSLGKPESIGFILPDCWGYIPSIECCVCCCELGDFTKAKVFNELAATYKPGSKAVEINKLYLENKIQLVIT